MKTVHIQARPKPIVEMGAGQKVPPLAEKLLETDNYWKVESQFSPRLQTLVSLPYSNGRTHIREYMGSTNCTSFLKEEDTKLGMQGMGVVGRGEHNQNTLHEIPNKQQQKNNVKEVSD